MTKAKKRTTKYKLYEVVQLAKGKELRKIGIVEAPDMHTAAQYGFDKGFKRVRVYPVKLIKENLEE